MQMTVASDTISGLERRLPFILWVG